jgi:NAD(P)-dependent dehydrogenase (short-subunit alcohol dehydrogenase family)
MSDKGQRVVIITGGSQGIGASLVTACPPGCLLVNSAVENAANDPEVAAVVRRHLARLEHCFTAALRTAIRRGEVPASVDPVSRARMRALSQGVACVLPWRCPMWRWRELVAGAGTEQENLSPR